MKNFGMNGREARIIHGRAAFATERLSTFHLVDLSDLIAARMKNEIPAIGVIGGSGLYQMNELRDATERKIDTPFGAPSDTLIGGKVSGREVYFLPRHARGHRLLPHELNHRANIYALRSLNVNGNGPRLIMSFSQAVSRCAAAAARRDCAGGAVRLICGLPSNAARPTSPPGVCA